MVDSSGALHVVMAADRTKSADRMKPSLRLEVNFHLRARGRDTESRQQQSVLLLPTKRFSPSNSSMLFVPIPTSHPPCHSFNSNISSSVYSVSPPMVPALAQNLLRCLVPESHRIVTMR